jgi:hypothetical protein
MPKIEVEIKAKLEKELYEAFEEKPACSGYNSKAEWLREQIGIISRAFRHYAGFSLLR